MTVGELREVIKDLDDDALVIRALPASVHGIEIKEAYVGHITDGRYNHITEDFSFKIRPHGQEALIIDE